MRRWNYMTDIMVTPADLLAFAWSARMRELAAQVGMSDVALKKLLRESGIATPPQGYWNKIRAGKPVPPCPPVPPRRPGGTGRLWLDKRFVTVLTPTPPMAADGPFASAAVPEDLDALRLLELAAIGQVKTPAHLRLYHPGLRSIMLGEAKRREKAAASAYSWHEPKFDNPVAQRRLRILNAIFLTLARRGHTGSAHERDGEIHAGATIGDTHVLLELAVAGNHPDSAGGGLPSPRPGIARRNAAAAPDWCGGSGQGRGGLSG